MPPTKIEIEGVKSGSRLSVRENEMVELKCIVHNAKPKATIVWFRENAEFYSGKHSFSLWPFALELENVNYTTCT